jgi:hypothetical protein
VAISMYLNGRILIDWEELKTLFKCGVSTRVLLLLVVDDPIFCCLVMAMIFRPVVLHSIVVECFIP